METCLKFNIPNVLFSKMEKRFANFGIEGFTTKTKADQNHDNIR
jgi:hypothetical protein